MFVAQKESSFYYFGESFFSRPRDRGQIVWLQTTEALDQRQIVGHGPRLGSYRDVRAAVYQAKQTHCSEMGHYPL